MPRQAKTLTKDALESADLIFPRDTVLPVPADMLALLDAELVKAESYGINPARVRIVDFDTAMVVSPLDQVPGTPPAPDFVSMVFQHFQTKRYLSGVGVAVKSHLPTAIDLTKLAVAE